MTPPAQRQVGDAFLAGLDVRECVAANPWAAGFLVDHVAVCIKPTAACVLQRSLQVFVREQLGQVLGWRTNLRATPHFFDLLEEDGVKQMLGVINVVGVEGVARLDLALGLQLDRGQLVRVGL